MSRKIPAALRRSVAVPTASTPRPGPVNNFYAKVSDGYMRGACQRRPERSVIEQHHRQLVAEREKREQEVRARADADRAVREAEEARLQALPEDMRPMEHPHRRRHLMLGALCVGMMAASGAISRK